MKAPGYSRGLFCLMRGAPAIVNMSGLANFSDQDAPVEPAEAHYPGMAGILPTAGKTR